RAGDDENVVHEKAFKKTDDGQGRNADASGRDTEGRTENSGGRRRRQRESETARALKGLRPLTPCLCPFNTGLQIDDHNQVAAKAAKAQLTHELLLVLRRIHTQKAQSLALADLARGENVEPGNGAKARAERMQGGPEGANVRTVF
ncbi:MAG: hypothetical protein ABIP46_00420, partial [Polaromonas sp.]